MAAEQGALRAFTAAYDCLPPHLKKDKKVLDSVLLAVFHSSCYGCVTGVGDRCQRCMHDDNPHPQNASWTGMLDFLIDVGYKPSKKYLESMSEEYPGKRKLMAYYTSKLRGEMPQEPAERPGLGKQKPLLPLQSQSLSNFLSTLDQMGVQLEPRYGRSLQKEQFSTMKAIEPKSRVCERCKGKEHKMMVCGRCRKAHYCSRECQKKDWKQHKQSCSPKEV